VSSVAGTITLAETLPIGGTTFTLIQKLLVQPTNIKISDMTVYGTNDAALAIQCAKGVLVDNVSSLTGSGGVAGASWDTIGSRNVIVRNCTIPNILDLICSFDCQYVGNILNSGCILVDGGSEDCLIGWNTITDPAFNGGPTDAITAAIRTQRIAILANNLKGIPATHVGINKFGLAGEGDIIIALNRIRTVDNSTTTAINISNSVRNTIALNDIDTAAVGLRIGTNSVGQMTFANQMNNVATPYINDATSTFTAVLVPVANNFVSNPGAAMSISSARPSLAIFNTSPANVTSFTGGVPGQEVILQFGDGNTTLIVSGLIHLSGSLSYNPPSGTWMRFYTPDGTTFFEQSRSTDN
jgi:hypothetical protein